MLLQCCFFPTVLSDCAPLQQWTNVWLSPHFVFVPCHASPIFEKCYGKLCEHLNFIDHTRTPTIVIPRTTSGLEIVCPTYQLKLPALNVMHACLTNFVHGWLNGRKD
jgi:hypothetical protein